MKRPIPLIAATMLALVVLLEQAGQLPAQTVTPPSVIGIAKPLAGDAQITFRGTTGQAYQVQMRDSVDPSALWFDAVGAKVIEIQTGIFIAQLPAVQQDVAFYRIVGDGNVIAELKGWNLLVQVSTPTNHLFFAQGEKPVITVTILDAFAQGITRTNLSTLALYLDGPKDPQLTKSAVKLLGATADRTKTPHHYIDLKSNTNVVIKGDTLTYTLNPVTDEAPGTYTAGVRASLGTDALQQIFRLVDLQIGTTNKETSLVVTTNGVNMCAACHLGTISGKYYMHHIDPSSRSPVGSPSLESEPVRSCTPCHNNDGYASFSNGTNKVPDAIVLRVHGVHMGEGLKLDFNTNALTGNFLPYTSVAFPADVRNCTSCHVDDRWKTQPSIMACGSCHDNRWFGEDTAMPAGWVAHKAGAATDQDCTGCHTPTKIATKHAVPAANVPGFYSDRGTAPKMDVVDVTLTRPGNGTNFVAGEKPVVTIVIKDDSGNAIDHTKVTDVNFSTASLFVYGPRSRAVPVLTSTAKNVSSKLRASVSSSLAGPWAISNATFKIAINGTAPTNIMITGASNLVTAAEVVASLNAVITNLNGGAKASVSGANVNIKTLIQGSAARIEIFNGPVTTAMGWKRSPNTVLEPDVIVAVGSTPSNDLRALADPLDYSDPKVTRTAANITYQLDDVAGLSPGTYNIYVYQAAKAGKIAGLTNVVGIGHLTFQVGTATAEKKVANCKACHGETIYHLDPAAPIHPEPFDTDYCTACHDYGHPGTGDMFKNQGGTSLNGWSGFGAVPISRRVHGIHYAHYLEHSEEIYANATKATFGEIIFPQDVRNCTKCHTETDSWNQNPSRVACLACHDSDAAKAHGRLMTYIPDPSDPYGPSAVESCAACHASDDEFSAQKVHAIANPYVPIYPREP